MRRTTLSTKLLAAALPLVLAVAALLALTVRNDLRDVQRAENGAELGQVWTPLIGALGAIDAEAAQARAAVTGLRERAAAIDAADSVLGNLGQTDSAAEREFAAAYDAARNPLGTDGLTPARTSADEALERLVAAVDRLDGADSAKEYVTAARSSLLSGRRTVDRAVLAPDQLAPVTDPTGAYERASRDLVAIGELLPSEAGDPGLGAELLSVLKLARAKLAADDVTTALTTWQADPTAITPLIAARQSFGELEESLTEFEAVAPEEWLLQYRTSGFSSMIAAFRTDLDTAIAAVESGAPATFNRWAFTEMVRQGVGFQQAISESIIERAEADVAATRTDSLRRIAITLGAVLLAGLLAWFITRSITRRVQRVAAGAQQVAVEQLPALVDALRDPRGRAVLPAIEPVPVRGTDELAELAQAFNSMQGTLVDVAHQQVEVLRRGVSDIFVTMARRNRSLIDRQLAMLDEFEAEVDDAELLANYYQLDHLATRMRRNSESLLVLANAEPKRKRVKATEIDDVVRASIGEVEEYRRIEIESLESLQVRGNVVADISHLLAELLDNATSFSPPDSVVRVGGRRAGDSYMIRIVDDGVGVGTERMRELNELLREPPIVGLSVESTLGMSVVSLLAHKHGIAVTLAAGHPGLTVDVVLPPTVFGPIETTGASAPALPTLAATPTPVAAAGATSVGMIDPATEPIVDWEVATVATDDDLFVPVDDQPAPPAPAVLDPFGDDDPRVVAGDWSKLSLDLSAFRSGMANATASPEPTETAALPVRDAAQAVDADAGRFDEADPFVEFDVVADTEPDTEPEPGQRVEPDLGGPAEVTLGHTVEPSVEPIAEPSVEPSLEELIEQVVGQHVEPPVEQHAEPLPRPAEFDRPLAPPLLAAPLSQRPVAPADALGAPPAPPPPLAPSLPTRRPGAGAPDGGPDRLADAASALESALDIGLPTRTRAEEPAVHAEPPLAVSANRLDPEALRDRLRAFQTEFRSGVDHEPAGPAGDGSVSNDMNINHSNINHSNVNHSNADLGGDRR